jgi:hypothetical protein
MDIAVAGFGAMSVLGYWEDLCWAVAGRFDGARQAAVAGIRRGDE